MGWAWNCASALSMMHQTSCSRCITAIGPSFSEIFVKPTMSMDSTAASSSYGLTQDTHRLLSSRVWHEATTCCWRAITKRRAPRLGMRSSSTCSTWFSFSSNLWESSHMRRADMLASRSAMSEHISTMPCTTAAGREAAPAAAARACATASGPSIASPSLHLLWKPWRMVHTDTVTPRSAPTTEEPVAAAAKSPQAEKAAHVPWTTAGRSSGRGQPPCALSAL
mmetsp:Transcript_23028/g.44010  ORF Transcript_23028/g.44010 Transcript_23028/m.44010 type:complete len:223 (-) Transcript_23028:659-1327(-)